MCVSMFSSYATAEMNGYVGAVSNQLVKDVGNVPGNRYWGDFFFDTQNNNQKWFQSRFTMAARRNDQALLMYSVQEAYIGFNTSAKDNFKFGRIILPWSTVDSTWGFGKLNNRRNFDGFQPGQEGLVGLSYERKSTNGFRLRAFVSGIYVPETNPGLDISKKNHTITSRNPWADPPATTADVSTTGSGNYQTIQYTVDTPQIIDIVRRYSAGLNLGWEHKHFSVEGFYIRKPENQLSSQVQVSLDPATNIPKAFVTPQVYYHDVYGGNLKYKNQDVEMYVSGMGIRPNTFPDGNSKAFQYTEIKTEKRREDYFGGGIARTNESYSMGLNYVARLSPFDRAKDLLVVDPRWNQAVNAFLMKNFGTKYSLSGDLKYDMLTTDRLVMLKAIYNVSKNLMMSIGVNMIGTPSNGQSYWSPYTNNDAAYGSLRYIF
jgi:hypothetical protein